jgi:hypothetical protein
MRVKLEFRIWNLEYGIGGSVNLEIIPPVGGSKDWLIGDWVRRLAEGNWSAGWRIEIIPPVGGLKFGTLKHFIETKNVG